jgi:hypothetical protein
MITVNLDNCNMTVQGTRSIDGIGSFYMIQQCMMCNAGGDAQLVQTGDTLTVSTTDLDYPGSAVEIIELIQFINHLASPEYDPIDAPATYLQYESFGDVAD